MSSLNDDNFIRFLKPIMEKFDCPLEEAKKIVGKFHLKLVCEESISESISLQAALLTAFETGRRAFLGGVSVTMPEEADCLLTPYRGKSFKSIFSKSIEVPEDSNKTFTLFIGGSVKEYPSENSLQVFATGWRGGVAPLGEKIRLKSNDDFSLGGVLSGALGVATAFFSISGIHPQSADKATGFSIWRPDLTWLDDTAEGPALEFLPQRLWLLGLGHLGQAYAWNLALLPFEKKPKLVLQDYDIIKEANHYSGILCDQEHIGIKKTRVCAQWLEAQGFVTDIVERPFDENTKRRDEEPFIAVCGFDSAEARSHLDTAGFDLVVECGLGGSSQNFDRLMFHSLTTKDSSAALWKTQSLTRETNEHFIKLLKSSLVGQDCGIIAASIDSKAVSSSFVGAFAGALVLGEILRGLNGGIRVTEATFNLRDLSNEAIITSNYSTEFSKNGLVGIQSNRPTINASLAQPIENKIIQ